MRKCGEGEGVEGVDGGFGSLKVARRPKQV
jgi:hypothetical protein